MILVLVTFIAMVVSMIGAGKILMIGPGAGEILWVHILYFITMIIFNGCTIDVARKARIEIDGEPISIMTELIIMSA